MVLIIITEIIHKIFNQGKNIQKMQIIKKESKGKNELAY